MIAVPLTPPPPPEIEPLLPLIEPDAAAPSAAVDLEPPRRVTEADQARDLLCARAFGSDAALRPEHAGRAWADLEPLLARAWAIRHDGMCSPRHDWRLTFRAVRQGWREARAREGSIAA